jgi:hypothetical protein
MRLMWSRWFLLICLFAVVVCVLAGFAETAWAAGGGLDDLKFKSDKKAKKVITAEPPTKKEIAIGVGSVVVAILVLKYL